MTDLSITRRQALKLAAGCAVGSLLPAGVSFAAEEPEPVRGGTMTLLFDREPTTLVSFADTNSNHVSAKVTEGLLWYDQKMAPQPQLATEWNVSDDGLTYTFKLRQNVKWHDGEDFDAEDVVYSLTNIRKVHPRARGTFANVTSIESPDPQTVVLKLGKPAPYMIKAFAAAETPIVPEHIYKDTDPATNPNTQSPIGTGPFKYKEWVRGSHVIFTRNENYWDNPRPYLDQLILRFVTDPAARAVALESQSADATYRTLVPLNDVERLINLPHLRHTRDGYAYTNNIVPLMFNNEHPIFSNMKVRQALTRATNRDAICKIVFYGMMDPCASPIAPFLTEYHIDGPGPLTYDLKAAETLLDEAGYPRGDDGVRIRAIFDPSPMLGESVRLGEYLRAVWKRIGVEIELRSSDTPTFIKRIYTDRDYQMTAHTLSNLFDPTVGVQRLYWSENIRPGVPFSNGTGYRNDRVDELLMAAASEIDPAKRKQQFAEFQEIVMEEVPDCNIGSPIWMTIYNQRAHGHSVTADGLEGNMANAFVVAS